MSSRQRGDGAPWGRAMRLNPACDEGPVSCECVHRAGVTPRRSPAPERPRPLQGQGPFQREREIGKRACSSSEEAIRWVMENPVTQNTGGPTDGPLPGAPPAASSSEDE